MVASAAMSVAVDRPGIRVSFRWLLAVALGLAAVAFVAGRFVFKRYGGYRPMALMHVPQTVRYRARVELNDAQRRPLIAPLLHALDPRGVRVAAIEKKLGLSAEQVHELAFGVGPDPYDFVVVLGFKPSRELGLSAGAAACEALATDGIRSQPTSNGCRLEDGAIVAATPDDTLVIASRQELVKGLLERVDIGDRLGFSGPSVRGVAPELPELGREASTLAQRISAKYP